jgi:hypothetical protein
MLGLGAGSTRCPPPKEEGGNCFFSMTTSPVELGAQAGAAKPLSPYTQGPLAWGASSSLSPNPAGVQREGRSEIRSPMEQASSPLKARLQVQGEEGTRGDIYPRGPKSRASWQHGLPAETAANSEARWSK